MCIGDRCSMAGCHPDLGCETQLVDADGDGYSPDSLACGSDCDDTRADVNPGQVELCDDVDRDCDGEPQPNEAPTWYIDCDADGFAPSTSGSVKQCDEPEPTACGGRWTTRVPSSSVKPPTIDCFDEDPDVRPNQQLWFRTASKYGFDYDCSKTEEPRWTTVKVSPSASCGSGLGGCIGASGWTTGTLPKCGSREAYSECSGGLLGGCERFGCKCERITVDRIQECH